MLSLLFIILICFFVLLIVIGILTFSLSGPAIANYIAYALFSLLAAVVLSVIAIVKK
tara:strand:- start:629 stop:799 length:171 start_codon:yes stop_codon:yes gene_type:complete